MVTLLRDHAWREGSNMATQQGGHATRVTDGVHAPEALADVGKRPAVC